MNIKELDLGQFNSLKDLQNFVNEVSKMKGDVRVISDRYDVDAKSILGMMIMLNVKNARVAFTYNNQADLVASCELLSAWAA